MMALSKFSRLLLARQYDEELARELGSSKRSSSLGVVLFKGCRVIIDTRAGEPKGGAPALSV